MIDLICSFCGESFSVFPHRKDAKFCSHFCYSESLRKLSENSNSNIKYCEWCEGVIPKIGLRKQASRYKKAKYCSKECQSQAYKDKERYPQKYGSERHNFRGRTTLQQKIRTNSNYIDWRNRVFIRDNYTCTECNKRGGFIEAHHIYTFANILDDYQITSIQDALKCDLLWDIKNGKTLCKGCHKNEHFGEVEDFDVISTSAK
jgi:5-methylcytosine-specific restriction endonuclease McrA